MAHGIMIHQPSTRILSIDTLRGIAIFGMILCANISWNAGLPAWMFHAQVPPPDYVFRPDVPGITWVDLVFPFFLFSMGAAFPFALGKRAESGQPVWKICLTLVKRFAILAAFSIVLGNCYRVPGAEAGTVPSSLFMIAAWAAMFLALTRFRFRTESAGRLLNISGAVLLAGLAAVMHYGLGIRVSKESSDIIIMVLAYVALFGGLIWLLTKDSIMCRWLVFIAIGAVKALSSYSPAFNEAFSAVAFPSAGWIFQWKFLQYLLVAIAGSVVGDMIRKRKDTPESAARAKSEAWTAVLALLTVVFQLWGLFTRHVTADLAVTVLSATVFFSAMYRKKRLWSDIAMTGYILLVAGIIFDPVDGGITKDHCNLSYLLTTSGMAAITTGVLLFLETGYGMKSRLLSECGQNPMIAYTVTNFLTGPLLRMTCLMPVIDRLSCTSQAAGLLRGLFITAIMMTVTIFFTRKKVFWRS